MFSVLSKVGSLGVIFGILALPSIDARSVDIQSEHADFFGNARGLNTNFPLIEALPKIDTGKPSQFNMASLEKLFNITYNPQQADKRAVRSSLFKARAGDQFETNRQARAGFYYSPDDNHLFPLFQESESFYPQDLSQLYSPQQRVSQPYAALVAESVPTAQDSSFEDNTKLQAEGRFIALPSIGNMANLIGSVGAGITAGPVNVPSVNAATVFGPQSGFTGIRSMFAISRPPVYNINIPTTQIQATPLLRKQYGISLANLLRAPVTRNDFAAIAPSFNSAGVGFFKGLGRL